MDFYRKNEGRMTPQRKSVFHGATKAGRGIVFPSHYPLVTSENNWNNCGNSKEKRRPQMEKEQSGIYMMEARVSPHRSDFRLFKTSIFFPAKSETEPPYLIIRPGVLLCPFTAPRSGNLTVLNFTHVKFRDHELNSVFLLSIFLMKV